MTFNEQHWHTFKAKGERFLLTVPAPHANENPKVFCIYYTDACQIYWSKATTLQHRSHLLQYLSAKKCHIYLS